MSSDRFVTLRTLADPIEAERMKDLLEQEGIPATIPGALHGGVVPSLAAGLQIPLQVPAKYAKRARRILDSLEDFEPAGDDEELRREPPSDTNTAEGPYRSTKLEDTEAGGKARTKRVAIGASIVFPLICGAFGAGHFYARSYGRGFGLLALGWACIGLAFVTRGATLLALPIVIAIDAVGAAAICERAQT